MAAQVFLTLLIPDPDVGVVFATAFVIVDTGEFVNGMDIRAASRGEGLQVGAQTALQKG